MSKLPAIVAGLSLVIVLSSPALAQTTRNGTPINSRPGAGTLDDQFTALYPNLQEKLGLNDADFAALRPKIVNVFVARGGTSQIYVPFVLRPPLPPGIVPRRGLGPPPWRQNPYVLRSPLLYAENDLQDAIKDPNTPDNIIKQKLDAYRAVVAKALADFQAAREQLRPFVTVRQEGVLVSYGLLD